MSTGLEHVDANIDLTEKLYGHGWRRLLSYSLCQTTVCKPSPWQV